MCWLLKKGSHKVVASMFQDLSINVFVLMFFSCVCVLCIVCTCILNEGVVKVLAA